MTELETLMLDVTGTLNHNGHNDVTMNGDTMGYDFKFRVGYYDKLPASFIETMEEYHNIRIEEMLFEDEDCGELYGYGVEIVDPDTGYTLNELNELDTNYTEEAMYLESVGADDTWGNA